MGFHTGPWATTTEDDSFNPGDSFDVADRPHRRHDLQGTLTYVRPDGAVVTATYLARRIHLGLRVRGTATG